MEIKINSNRYYTGAINKIKNIPNFPASSPIIVNKIPYLMLRNGDIIKIE